MQFSYFIILKLFEVWLLQTFKETHVTSMNATAMLFGFFQ
jgi:hypothetical protein